MHRRTLRALSLALLAGPSPLFAQSAYFSATGSFVAPSGEFYDFPFSLSAASDVSLRTWAHSGGTNAGGIFIPPGGIDSVLTLFDSANNPIDQNDNISASNHDSLINRPDLAAGNYRLRMTNAGSSVGNGNWATDVVSNSGSLSLGTPLGSPNTSLFDIALGGSNGGRATLTATDLSPLTLSGGATVNAGGQLNLIDDPSQVGGGTHTFLGPVTVRPGGTLALTGNVGNFPRLSANFVVIDGGHLNVASASVGSGGPTAMLTFQNGGRGSFATAAGAAAQVQILSGSQVDSVIAPFGRMTVSGAGSMLRTGFAFYGVNQGQVSSIVFSNGGAGTYTGLLLLGTRTGIGMGGIGGNGTIVVNGGANVRVDGSIEMGTRGGFGTIILDGGASRFSFAGNFRMGEGIGQTGAGTIIINGGVFETGTGSVDIRDSVSIFVNGGVLKLNTPLVTPVSGGGDRALIRIGGGTGAWTGRIDLTDVGSTFSYNGDALRRFGVNQLQSGYAGGDWDGTGIMSSDAAANPGYALGYELLEPSSRLRMVYTRYGDANLDRTVNLDDFNALAANFGQSDRTWAQGDFNYDFVVNLDDFNLLATNFGQAASAGGPTPDDWAALALVVPEPSSLIGIITLSAGALGRRRRRL